MFGASSFGDTYFGQDFSAPLINTKSVAGTLSLSGNTTKKTAQTRGSALSFIGATTKKTLRTLAGAALFTVQRTNLIVNPNFTISGSWTLGLNGGDGVLTLPSADQAQFGTKSAKLVFSTANAFLQQQVKIQPGATYTASAYVFILNNPGARTPRLTIDDSTTRGFGVTTVAGSATTGSWQRLVSTFTIPAGGVPPGVGNAVPDKINFIIDFAAPGGTGQITIYWDGAMLELGSATNAYFDGDSPGAFWHTTANSSQSIMGPGGLTKQINKTYQASIGLAGDIGRFISKLAISSLGFVGSLVTTPTILERVKQLLGITLKSDSEQLFFDADNPNITLNSDDDDVTINNEVL